MITNEDIFSIFQNTLSLMMQLDTTLVDSKQTSDASHDITGCVQISGEWQGAVVVQSSDKLAKLFAARMFASDVENLSNSDVLDAFAELTNMIGGNIKCQVAHPSFLSIPSVTVGTNYDFHLVGANVVRDVSTLCEDNSCRIVVWQYNHEPVPA